MTLVFNEPYYKDNYKFNFILDLYLFSLVFEVTDNEIS